MEWQRADDALRALGRVNDDTSRCKALEGDVSELVPDPVLWTRDAYNDAIVNIFTRLNTAGRTLTRKEVRSWLKSNWNAAHTGNKSAAECFAELQEELKQRSIDIGMDDVVNAVSFLWSVRFNAGKLLANSDLLKGSVIRPMAIDLSGTWSVISEAMLEVINDVAERGFSFGTGGQYASVNACGGAMGLAFPERPLADGQSLVDTSKG